ncbi:MAG: hypothetical protein ACIAS6_03180 [Phycisphaerales bacterium JB060]
MTTAHTSTGFERRVRRGRPPRAACLRLCWSVSPSALGRTGRGPLMVELELRESQPARVTLNGEAYEPAAAWASAWDGTLAIGRVGSGQGEGLVIAQALPLAVVVLEVDDAERPLHVACDLPRVLGLAGGRYELVAGGLMG